MDFVPTTIMSSVNFDSQICFGVDGQSGTATVMGTTYTFSWSVTAEAGLEISISDGDLLNFTITLIRLDDGSILRNISGLPGMPDLSLLDDLI